VASDFSRPSERALDRALELAAPHAAIDVVHFYHFPLVVGMDGVSYGFGPMESALADDLLAEGEKMLAARRTSSGPTLQFHVRHTSAIPGVVHWLEEQPCDLAALGSHGRRGFRRAMLGSVAETVVRRAPRSVLIARGESSAA
jgi:nucleotide-binding universal stress UspA family protein